MNGRSKLWRSNYKRSQLLAILVTAVFLLLTALNLSGNWVYRRLSTNGETSSSISTMSNEGQKYYKLYEMLIADDVSEGVQEIQKLVRVNQTCDPPPPTKDEEEKPIGSFEGTDHPDSHLITISCYPVHYRIPESAVQGIKEKIVFGVLSSSRGDEDGRSRRSSIRETWGKGNKLFFIVAGKWEDIEEEYSNFKDILWVDQPEVDVGTIWDKSGASTFKTEAFMTAMYDHVIDQNPDVVEYFFKTEDDCYVDVQYLKQQIETEQNKKHNAVDYWGVCIENEKPVRDEWDELYIPYVFYPYNYFPNYCIGQGIVMSARFVACSVYDEHIENAYYMQHEPHAIGLLAEKCKIQPLSLTTSPFEIDLEIREDLTRKSIVQHNVNDNAQMVMLDKNPY